MLNIRYALVMQLDVQLVDSAQLAAPSEHGHLNVKHCLSGTEHSIPRCLDGGQFGTANISCIANRANCLTEATKSHIKKVRKPSCDLVCFKDQNS